MRELEIFNCLELGTCTLWAVRVRGGRDAADIEDGARYALATYFRAEGIDGLFALCAVRQWPNDVDAVVIAVSAVDEPALEAAIELEREARELVPLLERLTDEQLVNIQSNRGNELVN